MERKPSIDCPVNLSPINQNKARLIALFVFLLSSAYLLFPHWSIAGLLVTDFFLRSFGMGRYSFLGVFSDWIIQKFSLGNRPVDSGPKEFAALIGFLISDVLFITSSLFLYDIGIYLAGMLVGFSFLEAAFGFCAGCHVYTFFKSFQRTDERRNAHST